MSTWAIIATASEALLSRQRAAYPDLFEELTTEAVLNFPILDLAYISGDVRRDLAVVGCSAGTCVALGGTFDRAVDAIRQRVQDAFASTIRGIAPTYLGRSRAFEQMASIVATSYQGNFRTDRKSVV